MLEMLRSLYRHMAWADSQILAAIRPQPAAADPELIHALHHIVGVQRFFLSGFLNRPFDVAEETVPCATFDELEHRFHETHEDELAFVERLDPTALASAVEIPQIPGLRSTVGEVMMQVVMHSQHHRGQCATRLRTLGGTPPTVDFILWLKDRPSPVPPPP
jgi:uncharacterized damage-inducible protein DinB